MNLQTSRCVCRLPLESDWMLLSQLYSDARTNIYSPTVTLGDPDSVKMMIARWQTQWDQYGYGPWVIESPRNVNAGAAMIGVGGVSLRDFDGVRLPNLWYRLDPNYWGQSYATEFAKACIAWHRRKKIVDTIFALVQRQNVASLRVLEKLEMQSDGVLHLDGQTSLRFRLDL